MVFFLILPILGIAYICWHLWVLLPLAGVWKSVVIAAGLACFSMLFLDLSGRLEKLPLSLSQVLYEIGTSSVIVLLYLVMAFLLLDLGRLFHLVPRTWLYANWVTTVALTGLLTTVFVCGHIHYKEKVRVALTLQTPKPLSKDYTIVMASDLHVGYHNTRRDLAHWVDLMNAEKPDIILIAGDIIDISVRPLLEENMAEEFRRLQAPVYACLGNHEYYSSEPRARQFYADAGIHLLQDTCAVVGDLCLIGRDDRTNRRRKPMEQLMAELDKPNSPQTNVKEKYRILLDHQPYHLEEAEQAGIDFQLSGHTHEGQVWPISWITHALYECSWGAHQRGDTHYYISSGLGIWGGKFRIGTQSEYVVMHLSFLDHQQAVGSGAGL